MLKSRTLTIDVSLSFAATLSADVAAATLSADVAVATLSADAALPFATDGRCCFEVLHRRCFKVHHHRCFIFVAAAALKSIDSSAASPSSPLLLFRVLVDLCHQPDDEEEEEEDEEHGFLEALLKRSLSKPGSPNADSRRICFPFQSFHVGSRQKIVILATVLVFVLMMTFAVVIWIGMGENPIDSSVVARVYVSLFAIAILLLGGALACYGLMLCLKMRTVRYERASSEMWKIAGLAVVSVICFTPSAFIAILTEIPVLYHWHQLEINGVRTSLLLISYYFVGSSVPSAFVLWVMRDLPPLVVANRQDESRTITFIHDSSATVHHPQRRTTATSSRNQISGGSPI